MFLIYHTSCPRQTYVSEHLTNKNFKIVWPKKIPSIETKNFVVVVKSKALQSYGSC